MDAMDSPIFPLVYDVSNRESFEHLQTWFTELSSYCNAPMLVKMVVGNKVDKDRRQISREEGLAFAQSMGTLFIESSAKTSQGVKEAFMEVVRKIIETPALWLKDGSGSGTIKASELAPEASGYCYC